jgi:hypothetical protein
MIHLRRYHQPRSFLTLVWWPEASALAVFSAWPVRTAMPPALPARAGDADGIVKTAIWPRGASSAVSRATGQARGRDRNVRTGTAWKGGSDAWP